MIWKHDYAKRSCQLPSVVGNFICRKSARFAGFDLKTSVFWNHGNHLEIPNLYLHPLEKNSSIFRCSYLLVLQAFILNHNYMRLFSMHQDLYLNVGCLSKLYSAHSFSPRTSLNPLSLGPLPCLSWWRTRKIREICFYDSFFLCCLLIPLDWCCCSHLPSCFSAMF